MLVEWWAYKVPRTPRAAIFDAYKTIVATFLVIWRGTAQTIRKIEPSPVSASITGIRVLAFDDRYRTRLARFGDW